MPYRREGRKIFHKVGGRWRLKQVTGSVAKAKKALALLHGIERGNLEPRRKVDNKMRNFGDTDYKKKTIRVNKKKAKETGKGELLDTIVHEETHWKHPKMREKTVRRKTKKSISKMSKKQKKRLYALYRS